MICSLPACLESIFTTDDAFKDIWVLSCSLYSVQWVPEAALYRIPQEGSALATFLVVERMFK